jgi:prophage regulatory protein
MSNRTIEPQEILYRLPDVVRITGRKRSTIYHDITNKCFPRPVQLGRQSVAWRKSDLDRWIQSRPIAGEDR